MPHTRHTKAVRKYQRAQKVRQEKELAALVPKLHSEYATPTSSLFIDETKEHRRVRRVNNQRYKPNGSVLSTIGRSSDTPSRGLTDAKPRLGTDLRPSNTDVNSRQKGASHD